MENRYLGLTKIQVPKIGLGTWAYTGGSKPIRRGIELGAFLVDTAESYGTEEAVGIAIKDIRNQVYLATKVSPTHLKKADVLRAADRSLKQLSTDWIDLYQVHWPNPNIPIGETMSAMEDLVDSGKIRHIGVSNFSVDQLKEAQNVLTKNIIVSNQVQYSLVKRRIETDLLPYCQKNGVTIIAYSPLGIGLPNILSKDTNHVIANISENTGKTTAQIVLNWCISKENVIAIPKANTIEHIEDSCSASGWRLEEKDLSLLDQTFKFALSNPDPIWEY